MIAQLLLINKWSQLGSFCMYRCCVHVMNSSSDSFTMPSRLTARGRSNLGYCLGKTEAALDCYMTSVTHSQNAYYSTFIAQKRKEITVFLSCGDLGEIQVSQSTSCECTVNVTV